MFTRLFDKIIGVNRHYFMVSIHFFSNECNIPYTTTIVKPAATAAAILIRAKHMTKTNEAMLKL